MPTLNAEKTIKQLLDAIHTQTIIPSEIIIVDSSSTDQTVKLASTYPDVKIMAIERKDFDHGGTRDKAIRASTGELIIFLTQDALPADAHFIENLTAPFSTDPMIAISSGRQIPRTDARPFERLVRNFNYPAESRIRSSADIPELGVKTFFVSDCCASYRRDIYERLGGFDRPILTAEDFLFAARAVNAGWKIAYAADARVIHSHNLSFLEQYHRNYKTGYETEGHKEYFAGTSQEKEGLKLVKYVSLELLKRGRILSLIQFCLDCGARLLGSIMGRRAWRKKNGELTQGKRSV